MPLNGYFGQFVIESKFGKFSVVGVNMLGVRVRELPAIEALQNVQQRQSFQDALLKSASAPVKFVESAVTNPAKTVENVAQGLGSVAFPLDRLSGRSRAPNPWRTPQSIAMPRQRSREASHPAGQPRRLASPVTRSATTRRAARGRRN